MADVSQTRDRLGRHGRLTEAGWSHILGRRPRMIGTESDVRLAIESAESIYQDANHPDREHHYRRVSRRTSFKVVVAYDGGGSGIVITAHPTHRETRREVQLWP